MANRKAAAAVFVSLPLFFTATPKTPPGACFWLPSEYVWFRTYFLVAFLKPPKSQKTPYSYLRQTLNGNT